MYLFRMTDLQTIKSVSCTRNWFSVRKFGVSTIEMLLPVSFFVRHCQILYQWYIAVYNLSAPICLEMGEMLTIYGCRRQARPAALTDRRDYISIS